MKRFFCLVFLFLLIYSCSQSENPEEEFDVPVTLIQTDLTHTITDEDLATVRRLFSINDLSLNNLQVYQIYTYVDSNFHVKCKQFYNSLPIFFKNIYFTFTPDSQLSRQSNERITELDISLTPEINEVEAAETVHDHIDDCLALSSAKLYFAELGIYDDYNGTSDPCFTLVWNIRSDTISNYPFAMVDAVNNKILAYDSGIRTEETK